MRKDTPPAVAQASDTTFCVGPPSPPPPDSPAATAIDDWPTLVGILCGRLTLYPDHGSDPPTETAHCLVEVACVCGSVNRHGRALDGNMERVDRLTVPHCRCSVARYHIRLAQPGEPKFENHKFDPTVSTTRPLRGRRAR